ncbi:MAG: hypothetical protein ACOH5I_12190 [Oligoflexus sp.]
MALSSSFASRRAPSIRRASVATKSKLPSSAQSLRRMTSSRLSQNERRQFGEIEFDEAYRHKFIPLEKDIRELWAFVAFDHTLRSHFHVKTSNQGGATRFNGLRRIIRENR